MFKKIILGGIALGATGYGIKKIYEIFTEDMINNHMRILNVHQNYKKEKSDHDNSLKLNSQLVNIFNKNQEYLLSTKNYDQEIMCYEFQISDFEFNDENFKQNIIQLSELLEKKMPLIISELIAGEFHPIEKIMKIYQRDFNDFSEEEKTNFNQIVKINNIVCTLIKTIKASNSYPEFMDQALKSYIEDEFRG
ncbi:hypothetical protein [Campylobacter taeniopygiae]|uniref:hypothetical protein n=1 Tax=Campylobacter taeniopygiae TaxID=2510188 RepID=UPI003D6A2956